MRVRRAANLAIDCKTINDALTMGYSRVTGNPFVPDMFEFYWQPPVPMYDPAQAKQLLAAAGYPNGFDAGFYNCDFLLLQHRRGGGEQSGVRSASASNCDRWSVPRTSRRSPKSSTRTSSRQAPPHSGMPRRDWRLTQSKGGTFAYGSYPELDALFLKQAVELDYKRREAILHQMQQIVHEQAIYAPIWQLAFINGVGPRVAELGFGRILGFPYTAPFEELALKTG